MLAQPRPAPGEAHISASALTAVPTDDQRAEFSPEFGRRFVLTVDTEEEFDWDKPLQREGFGLEHVPRLEEFQTFCENSGAHPIYLIDWPIANSELAGELLRDAVAAGRADVGIQLHPWVSPPHVETVTQHNSFAGNLSPELEREKLTRLRDRIADNFGVEPLIYRAGRYGVGPNTADLLRELGVAIDTSIRSLFNYSGSGGPDYRAYPSYPYWVDPQRDLLELPLTTVFSGMLRRQGATIHPLLWRATQMRGVLARTKLLERLPLTPEGVAGDEAQRAIDIALDDGLTVLNLSFHSPSLEPGHTPYVRTDEDLDQLYDWWRGVFAHLQRANVRAASVADIMRGVIR